VEAAVTEGAQQGSLAHTGVAHQDHLKQAVWGGHGPLLHPLEGQAEKEVNRMIFSIDYILKSFGNDVDRLDEGF
jgi:hypothetical protein